MTSRKREHAEAAEAASATDPGNGTMDDEAARERDRSETPRDTLSQGPASPGDRQRLEEQLAAAEAKRDEYLELARRVQADFENYRKRAAREQERLVAHAHERLVRELLPVLDDLERALGAAERHEEAALVDGVKLVEQALRGALRKEGVVEIETEGPFDPHVHEAMLTQPGNGVEPGTVLDVLQRGYRVGDRVVRPARVIVAE